MRYSNCIVNADFHFSRGIVIKKDADSIVIENPGSIITGKAQMLKGGISEPRNKTIMKMFNLIRVGERASSGVPDIFSVWEDEGWVEPSVEEQYKPDRTTLVLSFEKRKQAKKTAEKKPPQKTMEQRAAILEYLAAGQWAKTAEINEVVGVSDRRLRELLCGMVDDQLIIVDGSTKGRKYKIQ